MGNSETEEVLLSTVQVIRRARSAAPSYGAHPLGATTPELANIYRLTRTIRRDRHYEVAKAMALPFRDGHLIGRDPRRKHADLLFNDSHELCHVLSGEVGHFLTAEDTMSFTERRADLFAIVSLTPTSWMKHKIGGRKFLYAVQYVKQTFRELTEGWSEQRLWDRAKLRVMLYREHGI